MDKEFILKAIRKANEGNGGAPLGKKRFFDASGIRESDWLGKYWASWSEAVREAGFVPNKKQGAHDRDLKMRALAELVRRLKRFPSVPQMRLEKIRDKTFPNSRLLMSKGRPSLVAELMSFCQLHAEYSDCIEFLPEISHHKSGEEFPVSGTHDEHIYLIKSGKYYKIGLTSALYRRASQIANSNAEGAELIHSFETDDAKGIETYWHTRFAEKRIKGVNIASGEWFDLTPVDIAAFKRRKKFM